MEKFGQQIRGNPFSHFLPFKPKDYYLSFPSACVYSLDCISFDNGSTSRCVIAISTRLRSHGTYTERNALQGARIMHAL